MWVPVWNDRRWPAEQGVAAPQAPPQAQAWWSGQWGRARVGGGGGSSYQNEAEKSMSKKRL